MSFYYVKAIRLKKNYKVSVTAACNNVRPLIYYTAEYHGSLAELLESIQKGNFQLLQNAGLANFRSVSNAISSVIRETLDANGITWDEELKYGLRDRDKAIRLICEEYAERLRRDDWSESRKFAEVLGEKLADIIIDAQKNLEAAKKKDEAEGVIRINCACYSIFEDKDGNEYDLLHRDDGSAGFLLAPAADYDSAGKLKTAPENIVELGEESENLYAYLTGSGVDCTLDQYISMHPAHAEAIREKFALVDAVVAKAIDAGLKLIEGKVPYIGYAGAA